jgi:hypothetical protein
VSNHRLLARPLPTPDVLSTHSEPLPLRTSVIHDRESKILRPELHGVVVAGAELAHRAPLTLMIILSAPAGASVADQQTQHRNISNGMYLHISFIPAAQEVLRRHTLHGLMNLRLAAPLIDATPG